MSELTSTKNGLTDVLRGSANRDRNPAAVLWDMDGTLINTEPLWQRAELELAAEHGAHWTVADAAATTGKALHECAALLQERGVAASIPQIIVELAGRVKSGVRGGEASWMPGALEVLRELTDEGIPVALVTNAFRDLALTVIDTVPGRPFQIVVAGDDVLAGKPDPASYLKAAAALAVDPRDCVAIEDTETGAVAADAAGLHVLVAPGVRPVPPAEGRSRVHSLADVDLELLNWVAAGNVVDYLVPAEPARRGLSRIINKR